MTFRQKVLKLFYPALMAVSKHGRKGLILSNPNHIRPRAPFHEFNGKDTLGRAVAFEAFEGKKVLLVNTASDCGFTRQYEELRALHDRHRGKLVILAFPANDFSNQEKGTDEEIARFCEENYHITFHLMQKSSVVKSEEQSPVFHWLTHASRNGWNNHDPDWNFCKYLVSEEGVLLHYFASAISPVALEMRAALQ